MPLRIDKEPFEEVKDCIKQLSPNSWLLGSSLICERDGISSSAFRTRLVESDGSNSQVQENVACLQWSPPDPKGPIQFVRCIGNQATSRIGQWAYFKSRSWTPGQGTEAGAIKFVQQHAPSVPVPTVLESYVDPLAGRSYTLLLSVPGDDLNEVWKTLTFEQQNSLIQQVAEHIDTLAHLKNDKLVSAEGEMIFEPWLQHFNPETPYHLRGLLDPNKGKEWEQIWGVEENKFVFYHCDLGPTNIKVEVQMGEPKVTGLLDWEAAGFLPRGWIATKFRVSGGLDFDWDGEGEEDECVWREGLSQFLVEKKGYKEFANRWVKWKKNELGGTQFGYSWFVSLLPRAAANAWN